MPDNAEARPATADPATDRQALEIALTDEIVDRFEHCPEVQVCAAQIADVVVGVLAEARPNEG